MVKPGEAKISAVLEFPMPCNKRELRRFLGMTGYYRSFCPNFSALVSPLTDLLSTNRRFLWTSDYQFAFEAAKDLLCYAPVLSAPNFKLPFQLQVDASAVGAGAVLLHEDGYHIEHTVSYFSKKFSKAQQNYSVIEKEALAILLALQHFDVYLGSNSNPIVVYTDHNPLVFLSHMSGSIQRLLRRSLAVQGFNLDICHNKGAENVMADALSRVFNYSLAVPSILFPSVTGKSKGVDYKLLFVFLVVGVLHPHLFSAIIANSGNYLHISIVV